MLEPIYVALLQAAMRHVPEGTLTIDMAGPHHGWPDDGQDLILNNAGSQFTATLMAHDEAKAKAREWAGDADFVTTDPSSGARIMAKRVDPDEGDDQPIPRRGLVERFRAARGE